MQFNQIEFLILLLCLLFVVWRCNTKVSRNSVLLFFSYYFYAYWDIRFCGLLLFSTLVDFFIAQAIHSSQRPGIRKGWLSLSLVSNLGILGLFKYFDFFVKSADPIWAVLGWNPGTLNLILPVGISFFTFQTLSYTIDVYRGKIAPSNSLLDFSLYVAFFPQLVAGPIVRASELMPQLVTVPKWSTRRCYGGAQMVLRGMAKKVLLADRMGEMADVVFAGPDLYSSLTVWIAVIAYTGQIYYDFSGYSDMAIGIAKMLGYRFPANFRHPYLATSMSRFWRRWHMTLSRWLRDYVYISFGGNRRGRYRTIGNLMLTMLLGGLWHGAAWTFVLWGLWHGVALVVEHGSTGESRGKGRSTFPKLRGIMNWSITMFVVMIGWVLFRCSSLDDAASMITQMVHPGDGIAWFPPLAIIAIGWMFLEHAAWGTKLRIAMRLKFDRWYTPTVTTIMIWSLLLYAPKGFSPFVYFQF